MWTCSDDSELQGIGVIFNYIAPKEDLDLNSPVGPVGFPVALARLQILMLCRNFQVQISNWDFLVFKKHLSLFKRPLCKKVDPWVSFPTSQILTLCDCMWSPLMSESVSMCRVGNSYKLDLQNTCLGLFVCCLSIQMWTPWTFCWSQCAMIFVQPCFCKFPKEDLHLLRFCCTCSSSRCFCPSSNLDTAPKCLVTVSLCI